jgi:hypothetical protein
MKKSFFKHHKDILDKKTKITRSSTVFYFKSSKDFSTQVHFMNYWLEKRGNSDITMKISLRSMSGTTLIQNQTKLQKRGAFTIDIESLLQDSFQGLSIEGSIELEFFSEQDLFFPYPAVVVRYVGANWHTSAHSCQRNFSLESGDSIEKINEPLLAEEGNVTINNEDDCDPFFILHNGSSNLEGANLSVIVTSKDGRQIESEVFKNDWKPYQTRVFNLRELINYKSFLKNQIGTFKVTFELIGVFSRIIMGIRDYDGSHWSLDHSNFAATQGPVLNDLFEASSPFFRKNLVFNVPNNSIDGWDCGVDIYPTYPDDKYIVYVNKSNFGDTTQTIQEISLDQESKNQIHRIDCSKEGNFELSFDNENYLPRRFHLGIHYKIGKGRYAFLTDGPAPYTDKPLYSRWMPIFDTKECDNYLLIANRTYDDSNAQEFLFEVSLYNSFGENPLISEFKIDKYESKRIDIRDLFNLYDDYLKGDSGWIYLRSNIENSCVMHYASVKSETSIATDHAF